MSSAPAPQAGTPGAHAFAEQSVVVGRQPIVDRGGEVVAFELLYRSLAGAAPVTSEQMTANVILGALSIGVGRLVGDKLMFCNADRGALTGETPVTLPPDRTVLEILESVVPDEEVLEGCRDLRDRGYRLALDDFAWIDQAEELLELASVVKIDVQATGRSEVADLVERCRRPGVTLLAEKVETPDEVARARELGFDLFQGYAIEHPTVVHGQNLSPSALTQAQLAIALLAEDLDLESIEEILRHEPGLVVQLLQLASLGSDHGLRREVRTVREALVLLGTIRTRHWLALTVLSGRARTDTDALAVALVRARMCELLAPRRTDERPDFAFTAGLVSALDAILGIPRAELDARLELPGDVKAAAFGGAGEVGGLVDEVAAFQNALRRGESVPPDLAGVAAGAFAWALPYLEALHQHPTP